MKKNPTTKNTVIMSMKMNGQNGKRTMMLDETENQNQIEEGAPQLVGFSKIGNLLVINFGRKIEYLGLYREEALKLGETLIKLSNELDGTLQ